MRAARVLAICAGCVGTAHARPTITVDDSVPFTAQELSAAIEIRVRDSDVPIHIARRAGDIIVISVGDRARSLEVDGAPPRDLARVVALVVEDLADVAPPAPPAPPSACEAGAPSAPPSIDVTTSAPRTTSRYALRATLGYQRTDTGVETTPVLASLATSINAQLRFVVSAGFDEHGEDTTTSVVARLGLEGRFGVFGIEMGGAGFAFRMCHKDIGVANGVYGTGRLYLPVSRRAQLVLEAGGYYTRTDFMTCGTSGSYDPATGIETVQGPTAGHVNEYAGHVGIGAEWAL